MGRFAVKGVSLPSGQWEGGAQAGRWKQGKEGKTPLGTWTSTEMRDLVLYQTKLSLDLTWQRSSCLKSLGLSVLSC